MEEDFKISKLEGIDVSGLDEIINSEDQETNYYVDVADIKQEILQEDISCNLPVVKKEFIPLSELQQNTNELVVPPLLDPVKIEATIKQEFINELNPIENTCVKTEESGESIDNKDGGLFSFEHSDIVKTEEVDIKCEENYRSSIYSGQRIKSKEDISDPPLISQLNNKNDHQMHKCNECDYKTSRYYNLKRHLLKYKNPNEIEMYKCHHCEYKSFRKHNLMQHLLKHKNPEELNMYKCDECDYQAFRKDRITEHKLRHREPDGRFQCNKCSYKAYRKDLLKQHYLTHEKLKNIYMYKCHECNYQTCRKGHLIQHIMTHKKPDGVVMHKCDECDYQTFRKESLKRHLLTHKNLEERNIYKCDECDYKTLRKDRLKLHQIRHKKL